MISLRGMLGDTMSSTAPPALQQQVVVLVGTTTELLGTAQAALTDLHQSGLDDATYTSLQTQLTAIAQEIDGVRVASTAMNAAEANAALSLLHDNETQLARLRDKLFSMRGGVLDSISMKTLVWGASAVALAGMAGFWILSRRREVRRRRRAKKQKFARKHGR